MLIHESAPPVATQLESFHTAFVENAIMIAWTLAQAGDEIEFFVYRTRDSHAFEKIAAPEIVCSDLSFSFRDETIEPGGVYRYRIEVSDEAGRRLLFKTEPITIPVLHAMLYQNNPNPFNPSTTIMYYLPQRCDTRIELFDASGRRIVLLVDSVQQKGVHTIDFNGKDHEGNSIVSGVYFYRLRAGKQCLTRKMTLLR